MAATKDLICQAAKLPCSVIIVGLGDANFDAMDELDGDTEPIRDYRGVACSRDIVQFVKYNDCIARGNLAEEVLREVPTQVCQFMESVGFVPQPVQFNQAIYSVAPQMTPAQQLVGHHLQNAMA